MRFRRVTLSSTCLLATLILTSAGTTHLANAQTPTLLYQFGSASGDPVNPAYLAIITQGRDGNMYSTSPKGGANQNGAAFKFSPNGTESVLHSFLADGSEGTDCISGFTLGRDGNLYGACPSYPTRYGTLYKLTSTGTFSLLHTFVGGSNDGAYPFSPPTQASDGNFYGVTYSGGGVPGPGTFYQMTPGGTTKMLYVFSAGGKSQIPYGPLVLGSDGYLYGSNLTGGAHGGGAIIKISTKGKRTDLYAFNSPNDGNESLGGVIQGSDGNYYGCTYSGGLYSGGTAYKVTPKAAFTVLRQFGATGSADGVNCQVGLVQATDGSFYGVQPVDLNHKKGTIFKIDKNGTYSIPYYFDGTVGATPTSALFQNTNGLLYGLTTAGGIGTPGQGIIYSFNIGAKPFARLELTSGVAGNSIGIFGQGFLAATGVTFGGVSAAFTPAGDNYMTVTVPSAGKSGAVVVNIPSGNLTSSKPFKLLPTITSFTPSQGLVGTVVTITGTGFVETKKVTFGGVAASFTPNSGTQITATVPTGAKTGKIAVTTKGGSASSKATFTVTT
jgi:uncharacterized repeat protein (TIGR03803 family)